MDTSTAFITKEWAEYTVADVVAASNLGAIPIRDIAPDIGVNFTTASLMAALIQRCGWEMAPVDFSPF